MEVPVEYLERPKDLKASANPLVLETLTQLLFNSLPHSFFRAQTHHPEECKQMRNRSEGRIAHRFARSPKTYQVRIV